VNPASGSGPRTKDADKQGAGTFFLGRYRVVDEIGVGGMASVHLARMDGPGGFQKWVAIKRIHPHLVEDDQFVDMFLDEARIAAGINHANVAQVFDLGKDDNTYWIAMEYLHGEPLREVMRRAEDRGQRISPELAARICSDAAEGLHAAHELRGKNGQLLGLVHRDVTPHNLFLTYDGYTKVVDFGIAKVADRLSSTRAGTLKGKLAYMSPEQVRGAEVDRTTDIFALGVVLWEITTNQRLFRMDTDLDTLEKVQACVVPPPSTIVPGYPPELEACVMKALSKRKQDRFPTAREFSRALQQSLVRSGRFVGPEEVAQFVRTVFGDRIQKREAHLAWAAEVTGTLNVDQLRKKPGAFGEEGSPSSRDEAPKQSGPSAPQPSAPTPFGGGQQAGPSQTPSQVGPASGERARPQQAAPAAAPAPLPQIAAHSLMDDDEDVPTTVATREALDFVQRGGAVRPAAGLPPATGAMPAAPPPQGSQGGFGAPSAASYQANAASYAANVGRAPAPAPAFGGFNAPPGMNLERTAAISSPADLGSTVALPSTLGGPDNGPPHVRPNAGNAPSFGAPPPAYGYGQNGQPPPGGPTFGQPPPGAPTFGAPANPAFTPAGMVGGVPMNLPMPGQPGAPQSQIETALSLPRPDPTALWMAQQEKAKGERRNSVVLVAVVALTALCVLGIGVLIYFKLRARADVPATPDPTVASATAVAPAGAAPDATSTTAAATAAPTAAPAPPPPATAAATAAPTAAPAPPPAATAASTSQASTSTKPAGDPGFLTIVCNPACDNVIDQGKSLGPAPVVHLAVAPGQHRITLKNGKDSKVISVMVVSGQVTAQRVSMK
jgi:serine/threonine-protein kinase